MDKNKTRSENKLSRIKPLTFNDSRINLTSKVNDEFEHLDIDERMSLTQYFNLLDKEKNEIMKRENITEEQYNKIQQVKGQRNELSNEILDRYYYRNEYSVKLFSEFKSSLIEIQIDKNKTIDEFLLNDLSYYRFILHSISFDTFNNRIVLRVFKDN